MKIVHEYEFKAIIFPNRFRGHAVMLSTFVLGSICFIFLTAGFSAALGLLAGIIMAPIGFLAVAAMKYIVRKSVNLEFRGLRKEAKHNNIELSDLNEINSGDLFETSKLLFLDRDSLKAVFVSLAKFQVGLASLVFITSYLSISISLFSATFIYRYVELQFYGNTFIYPVEWPGAVLAGLIIFVLGVPTTEKSLSIIPQVELDDMINLDSFFDNSENGSRPLIELIVSFAVFLIPFFVSAEKLSISRYIY